MSQKSPISIGTGNRTVPTQSTARQVRHIACVVMLVPLVVGCQSARFVTKTGSSGIVAIPSDSDAWPFHHRRKAEALMSQHFPEGYLIEREQEAVVGTTTDVQQPLHNARVNAGGVTFDLGGLTTAKSRNETEWHIHYRRK